jgi:hypothetical protein
MSGLFEREARLRIQALEEQGLHRDRKISELSDRLLHLEATIEAVRDSGGKAAPPVAPARPPPSPAVSGSPPPAALASVPLRHPQPVPSPPDPRPPEPPRAPPAGFASLIVSRFPALFAEFCGKRFALLWRGSRDGFLATDFHGRCDGRANTLTLIEDTAGNIFGGFTPVEWESRAKPPFAKGDPSLNSFLFTLKNPHNFPARTFALKAGKKGEAIYCHSSQGPTFCGGLVVATNCGATNDSYSWCFGTGYVNDTGVDGRTFLTASTNFTVKEIEVFEITS